jgi:hypothetical protein
MERFWAKVNKTETCWLWTGCTTRPIPLGYGRIRIGHKFVVAHRYAWMQVNGPIPEGLELDHLCKVRHCVNPDHLEPVDHLTNVRRGERGLVINEMRDYEPMMECHEGHRMVGDNIYVRPDGYVQCRECNRRRARELRARRRIAA